MFRETTASAVLVGCAMACSGMAAAADHAPRVELLRAGITHDALFSVDVADEEAVAVGSDGLILRSLDGGASWQADAAPDSALSLLDVALGPRRSIAVGQMGAILESTDRARWTAVASPTDKRLLAVAQRPDGVALAVGQFGTVLRSAAPGQAWQPVAVDWRALVPEGFDPQLYDVMFTADGRALLVGEFGMILASDDGGQSWRAVHAPQSAEGEEGAELWAIDINARGLGVAVGQQGRMLLTDDGGRHWRELDTGFGDSLMGVDVSDANRIYVTGIRRFLESGDGGRTWRALDALDLGTAWYQAVRISDGDALVVGHSGRILRIAPD